MELTKEEIDKGIKDAIEVLECNPTKRFALVYPQGFVPNAYKWRAPGERLRVTRDGNYNIEWYDRKRSYGVGPYISLWR